MQGCQPYQERLFSTINLRGMIPDNHLLVKINDEMNFSFIYDITNTLYCKNNGCSGRRGKWKPRECHTLILTNTK